MDQITSFKEMIAKVLDKGTSLAEKIKMLFREQGITIASMLMAIRMAIGETIAKVLDKGTSLAEKIRMLFREQDIMIASILTAIGVLVDALLPGGGGTAASGGKPPPPKDEKGAKEWLRNKLKPLASLLGKLGMKAAEALPGSIGAIISWILNRAKEVVGWVSQNVWALVVSIRGLLYVYIITKK